MPRAKEKERLDKEKMERALNERRCPVCENKIYAEGSIIISEVPFHRQCVKCIGKFNSIYFLRLRPIITAQILFLKIIFYTLFRMHESF